MLFWRLQRDPTQQEPGRIGPEVGQYLQIQSIGCKIAYGDNWLFTTQGRNPQEDMCTRWRLFVQMESPPQEISKR